MLDYKILVKVGNYWVIETDEVCAYFKNVLKAVHERQPWSNPAYIVLNAPLKQPRIQTLEVLPPDENELELINVRIRTYRTGQLAYKMPDSSVVWRYMRVVAIEDAGFSTVGSK